jgi:16S rRNA (guanine527-N7)-methyltransferase
MERCSRILDLGTGGGLPGIPLSIVCKNVTFVLLDSTAKKVRAVREMVASLSLSNTEVVLGRAEQIGKLPGYAHSFDAVIARSVAPLYELAGWGKPFLRLIKKSGTPDRLSDSPFPAIIATKGGNIEGEIGRVRKRFPRINCSLVKLDHLNLSGDRKDDKSIIVLRFPSI